MTFKLSPELEAKFLRARELEHTYRVTFANLSDADLVASAKFWMQHCEAPQAVLPDEPIYDSTFWHVIIPEMLRRLERK